MLYDILREVGEDLRAVAKTKISDMARGESKSHVSQSTLTKINAVDGKQKIIVLECSVKGYASAALILYRRIEDFAGVETNE